MFEEEYKKNPNSDKINWEDLSENPGIFTYDYEEMKEGKKEQHHELALKIDSPGYVSKYLSAESHPDSPVDEEKLENLREYGRLAKRVKTPTKSKRSSASKKGSYTRKK